MISQVLVSLAADAAPQTSPLSGFAIPLLCFGVIFYFLILRPQKLQQKKHADLLSTLKTGDQVVTSGGIHGIISNIKEGTTLMLKVEDGRMEVDKSAIATIKKD